MLSRLTAEAILPAGSAWTRIELRPRVDGDRAALRALDRADRFMLIGAAILVESGVLAA